MPKEKERPAEADTEEGRDYEVEQEEEGILYIGNSDENADWIRTEEYRQGEAQAHDLAAKLRRERQQKEGQG